MINWYSAQSALDEATAPWGVKVERVEVKDVRVPENLQRAMAAEAEAAREARAKVIAAEGEHKASRAIRHAAEVIADSPAALQVVYRQKSEVAILSISLNTGELRRELEVQGLQYRDGCPYYWDEAKFSIIQVQKSHFNILYI